MFNCARIKSQLHFAVLLSAFLFSPNMTFACQICVTDAARVFFPGLEIAFVTMCLWAIARLYADREKIGGLSTATLLGFLLLVGFVCFFALHAGVLLVLIGLLIARIYLDFAKPLLQNKRPATLPNVMNFAAIFVIIMGAAVRQAQLQKDTQLERFLALTSSGSGIEGEMAEKVGQSADFYPGDLEPWILSDDGEKVSKAFQVLYSRKEYSDLLVLENAVLSLDSNDYELTAQGTGPYLRFWLDSLGASDVTTTVGLRSWIDSREMEP